MKPVIAVVSGLSACEFVGPSVAGALGLEATSGFDMADVVCILLGLGAFFLVQLIASYF